MLTHSRLAALLEHEHASLALAQRCSGIKEAGVPLFSSLLNYRHNTAPATENPELLNQKLIDIEEFSNYPLAVSIEDNGESLGVTAQAVVSRIDPARVCAYMQQALESLADALENDGAHLAPASVAELDVVPVEERALQIETWNMTEQHEAEGLDHKACLHHLFEKHAEQTPEAVAVVFKDQSLTYGEAKERANHLAHRLARLGVQFDSLIGICVERSLEMITSSLAVLKVGDAYNRADREALGGAPLESMLSVLDPADVLEEHLSSDNIRVPPLTPSHLADVIYTSGSTGQPKDMMADRKGVFNLNRACRSAFGLGLGSPDSTRTTQFFSFAFDGSVCEIFPTLCSGGTLHLLQNSVPQDISQQWKYIEKHAITHAIVTPSVLQDCRGLTTLSNATTFVLAREVLSSSVAYALRALVPNGEVINAYGPTEATVVSTFYKAVVAADIDNAFVPIGRPVLNKRIYILDQHRQPLPLARPARFISEIEARLVEHPQASDVVVVASRGDGEEEDGDERLVTYVIEKRRDTQEDDTPLYQALRAFLATKLPAYIVPASFVRMDSFPLTTSGKLNRLALPASTMTSTNMDAAVAHAGYEPLRGPIESAIALVWMDLLRVARIRRHDDFFAIGGHSLLGVKMIGRLRPILGSRGDKGETMISLRTMFEAPTIAQMPVELGGASKAPAEQQQQHEPSASSELFEASFQALLPIRPSGTRAPLFCIHPGPQLVLQRSDKTSCEDQPLYGLQACGFGEGEAPAATLAEMVEDYIVQVRSVQPSGPYHLLEYSFGGLVTHTMATKLKMGERVAFWTVMDTSAGYAAARAAQEKAKEKKEEEFDVTAARRIFQMDEDYETDLTLSFLERATRVLENNIRPTRSAEASPQSLLVFGGDFLVLRAIVLEEGVEAVEAESGGRKCKEKSRLWMLSVHTTR
ncbi:hypothetical protein MVEG_10290 [Podila verticillata NRRL 6337]|nr:hypothetical protein MVEG_10290 [Podila verticillata NRRL 6337]